jgi:hypothetical protein
MKAKKISFLGVLIISFFLYFLLLPKVFEINAYLPLPPSDERALYWDCDPYCCGGEDGLNSPEPRDNQASNKSKACDGKPTSTRLACEYKVCNCLEIPPEKGYGIPWPNPTELWCCTPYYLICTRTGNPVCNPCTAKCPAPLVPTAPVSPPHDIEEYKYENIGSCSYTGDGCSVPPPKDYITCYEPLSPVPDVDVKITHEQVHTELHFISSTHTGAGEYGVVDGVSTDNSVNDFAPYSQARYPISDTLPDNLFNFKATYSDGDQPIEAAYVWFTKNSGMPITPYKIDLDNNSSVNEYGPGKENEFGFLIHKEGDNYIPYIPSIEGDGINISIADKWKRADLNGFTRQVDGKTILSLPNSKGATTAEVLLYSITPSNSGKTWDIVFSLSFKDEFNSLLNSVPEDGKYNIWLMGNDTFGFTPYDNYNSYSSVVVNAIQAEWESQENIRYYDLWNDTGFDWNIDLNNPIIDNIVVGPSSTSKTAVTLSWRYLDTLEFSNLVLNIFKDENMTNLVEVNLSNYSWGGCVVTTDTVVSPYELEVYEEQEYIGNLDGTINPYAVFLEGGGSNDCNMRIDIDLGNNDDQGLLYFIITGFDKGGNVSKNSITLDTRDWIVTYGGLLYSYEGSDFPVRTLTEGEANEPLGWSAKIPPLNSIPFKYADLSSELIGDQTNVKPSSPVKSELTNNFHIPLYPVPTEEDPEYYEILMSAFDKRRDGLNITEKVVIGTLSGNLIGVVGSTEDTIVLVEKIGDLVVKNGFNCNGKGIIFVDGNLTFQDKTTNNNALSDACIFVVSGNVTFETINNETSEMTYDQVNAYILANGEIRLNGEQGTHDSYDGLYVDGGLHALNYVIDKNLQLTDRLRFPTLVVRNQSKYGVLAEELFGTETQIQITEVGVKY